jgi:hypothetical protein
MSGELAGEMSGVMSGELSRELAGESIIWIGREKEADGAAELRMRVVHERCAVLDGLHLEAAQRLPIINITITITIITITTTTIITIITITTTITINITINIGISIDIDIDIDISIIVFGGGSMAPSDEARVGERARLADCGRRCPDRQRR